jgi:histidyl-tRNA synthetase
VLDGVMEAIGVTDANQKLAVLRAIDKLDKFGVEGVSLLLGKGRTDESGDFTKGAGLDPRQIADLLNVTGWNEPGSPASSQFGGIAIDRMRKSFPQAELLMKGCDELDTIWLVCQACGYDNDRVRIDPSVVRGLEYYTGPVYECELTFPVVNEDGETVRFGSVAGGGRYDGLVKRFTGQDVPATGFSIGVSRLVTALKNLGKLGSDEIRPPVLVTVMDRDTEALGRYQQMTQELRNAGIRAEMFQGNPKDFGKQLKYADRRGCPLAIIQGSDERSRGEIVIKDLAEGRRQAEAIASNAEWRAARVAQVTVPEGELVAKVREMLAAISAG